MKEIPEATKAYNKRHSVEVKVALDVLRQYVIGLDSVKGRHKYPCDYCIMEDVCFELFGKCCPTVFEYHRNAATDEITCVTPGMDCDMVVHMTSYMDKDDMIALWRDILKKSLSISMVSDDRCIYLMLKHLSSQFLIRTRKYSNNETALDKFYDEYEQEVENETR